MALLLAIYLADWAWFLHRTSNPGNALGSVTFYYASALKDGKAEVYFDQPQTEICVHSLFPHSGHSPCWYASRKNNVRTID
ncbi:MAG TPA: hypothetical protein VN884_05495 [Candidatus Sulfotelmatobacter sp.]|nr:hypothetical protein [Candidatus Sulfotelmatobacter sp.]